LEQRSRLHRTAEGHALTVTGRKPMQSQTSTKPRNTTNSIPPSPGILVSDFDGTITTFDFYDLVSREFPKIAGSYWQQYEAGEICHFEALRSIFAGIRAPEARIFEIVKDMRIEPRLAEAVAS
jgi:hypothetical protein